ncbi:MAG: cupin domain-containing protein [Acidobacteria bacterium]|jgi:mannose-6-phosphate isomerase-like protein (cupin superfamily)|nr:cupin domain-containing protein [Acidobacteriota bacterium]
MIIKTLSETAGFRAGDASSLRELLHPAKEALAIGYSLAHAVVAAGRRTLPHRLKQAEVYYILEGRGRVSVGDETAEVGPGQAVYIPPRTVQSIEAIGPDDLAFLCLVDPAWTPEAEEIL